MGREYNRIRELVGRPGEARESLTEGFPDINEGRSIDDAFSEALKRGLAEKSAKSGFQQLLGATALPKEEIPSGSEVAKQYGIPEQPKIKIPFKEDAISPRDVVGYGLDNVSPMDIMPMGAIGRIDDVVRGAGKGIKIVDDLAEQMMKQKLGKVAVKPELTSGLGKIIRRGEGPKGFGKVINVPIPEEKIAEQMMKKVTPEVAEVANPLKYERIKDFLKRIKRD